MQRKRLKHRELQPLAHSPRASEGQTRSLALPAAGSAGTGPLVAPGSTSACQSPPGPCPLAVLGLYGQTVSWVRAAAGSCSSAILEAGLTPQSFVCPPGRARPRLPTCSPVLPPRAPPPGPYGWEAGQGHGWRGHSRASRGPGRPNKCLQASLPGFLGSELPPLAASPGACLLQTRAHTCNTCYTYKHANIWGRLGGSVG